MDDFREERRRPRRRLSKREIEERKKKRKKKLFFRRAGILLAAALIIFLFIVLIVKAIQAITAPDPNKATADEAISETATETPVALSFKTPSIPDDKKTSGHYSEALGAVYIYNNMALDTFSGDELSAKNYADTISEFKGKAPSITVYNMVVPSHIEFSLPKRLIDSGEVKTNSQSENIKHIYENYSADVKPINCYNALSEHASDYIFFNTDLQLTGLGGYYAYQAFAQQSNQRTLNLSVCTEHVIDTYTGSLSYTDDSVSSHPDSVHFWTFPYNTYAERYEEVQGEPSTLPIYYEDESSGELAYGVFIWGDCPLFVEHNEDIDTDKKIAVVKESTSNPFVSYLTADYKEVHIIDYRYFTGSLKQYCQKNEIDEVLFVNSITSANNAESLSLIRAIF